ncbi:hypothetical protein [Candidatus Uabimicrobium sp. HlEnr_7]|uniref:hypothetical protein n=1 Tax=Candidatus Uabimicrobium helgolandensis TaxID=3095367 RepID=UPI003558FB84
MRFFFIFFIATTFIFSKTTKLYIFESPELVTKKTLKNNSVSGIVDLDIGYEKLHSIYINNTKKIESSHFSKKINIKNDKKTALYHLVYTHWLVGELFKLEEKHQKINKGWWLNTSEVVFPSNKKTEMWVVNKYLLKKTKHSWVGDNLEHLEMMFVFIKMGKKKTRLFFHMIVNAEGCRTTDECKEQTGKILNKILCLARSHMNK